MSSDDDDKTDDDTNVTQIYDQKNFNFWGRIKIMKTLFQSSVISINHHFNFL